MIYNKIYHDIRNSVKLSMLDYCLLESIHQLCNSDKALYKGWCNASKSTFDYLATGRTIATRYKHLEENGWLEFNQNRMLKKTTAKYTTEIYSKMQAMKKLHSEETSSMKELHPTHEETSPSHMKELHPTHEETSPNTNNDTNNDINIDTNNDNFKKEKKEDQKNDQYEIDKNKNEFPPKKVAPKKGSGKHEFPDLTSGKKYDIRDKRIDKTLPFQSNSTFLTVSSFKLEELQEYFRNAKQIELTKEQFEKACQSFSDDKVAKKYKTFRGVSNFSLLESRFLEWVPKSIKYENNAQKYNRRPNSSSGSSNQNSLFITDTKTNDRNAFIKS